MRHVSCVKWGIQWGTSHVCLTFKWGIKWGIKWGMFHVLNEALNGARLMCVKHVNEALNEACLMC